MGALFLNAVLREHKYHLRVTDGGKPVGYDKGGPVGSKLFQGLLYDILTFVIQRAGGLVKDKDGTLAMESLCFWPPESFMPRCPMSVS